MDRSTHYEVTAGRHVWTRRLDSIGEASKDVKVQVFDGHLLVNVKGQQIENITLPPNAYTDDAHASYQRGTLRVDMAVKEPGAPAMVEKALRDPDRPHPREVPLVLTGRGQGHLVATGVPLKEDPTGRGTLTPAQAEFGARNDQLFGRPEVKAVMPDANLASTVASDMPVLTNPGAALEAAADNGETVVVDPKSSETKIYVPKVDQLAERLGRAELAPAGTTVVQGARDKVVEAEHNQPNWSGAWAGKDQDAHADQYTRKTVDYTEEKVGMATRPLEARDFYATCESATEPFSSVKVQATQGDPSLACDMCRCAPCQCDKVDKGFPYELTPPEQRRSGKPSVRNYRKAVTGQNAHAAHDYKLHSKVRSEEHTQVEFLGREHVGNVPQQGAGSLEDLPAKEREKLAHTIVGGREIDLALVRDHTRTAEAARHFLG
ncbi:hypothetical protein Vretimale_18357 [Volvox reticuliferus]|uniref:SHSP domain-containing protein n=1 Tax=Volvox reticuliferus TaxID=1737510 RepID=A0A8J4LZ94_9CHLO|nr:hypothetical protein Vretifemale_8801 [Volvox reticuliferus]GIM15590.1 hypothetical protein Vretimale_18357 [Volvox reticuliferus]